MTAYIYKTDHTADHFLNTVLLLIVNQIPDLKRSRV